MPTPTKGYYLDGARLPSVTTILKRFKASDGLITWAYNQGREGKGRYETSDKAKGIGTMAHARVEAHLKRLTMAELLATPDSNGNARDALPDLAPEDDEKAQKAFESYATWERHSALEVVSLEEPLMCRCHRFGGTPDAIALIDFDYSLVDFKTANDLYVDVLLQLAAYGHLWDVNHPDMTLTGGFHALRFAKDAPDFTHKHFGELSEAWEMFELLRRCYDIDKRLEKRAK